MSGRQAVCKFYKQGHCSYGNNCRFYHPPSNNGGYNGNNYNNNYSNNYNNNYNNNNNAYNNYNGRGKSPFNNGNNTTSNNTSTVETPQQFCDPRSMGRRETEMRNDMLELEEMLSVSNHVFTSYSLKPPVSNNLLPSRDFSYEEDRLQYYLAKNSNTIPQYQQQVTNRHQDMIDSTKFIKLNTQKCVRYLQLSVQNPNSNPKPLISPIDINASSKSNNSNSIFGNITTTTTNNNLFGGSSNAFGSSTNTGGAFSNQNLNSSPFSSLQNNANATNSTSPFGQSGFNKPAGAFGSTGFGASTTNAISNPFGASPFTSSTPPPTTTNSPFGAVGFGQSGFGKTSSTQTSSNTSNPFGASSSNISNPFGASSTNNPNPFGASPAASNTNPFGSSSTNPTPNPFSNATMNNNSGNLGNNTNFNGGAFPNQNVFQNNNQNPGFGAPFGGNQGNVGYKQSELGEEQTKLENVTGEILVAFKSEVFELGKVPDIPPPIELC